MPRLYFSQAGFINHWQATGTLLAGLILTCIVTYQIMIRTQQQNNTYFLKQADKLHQTVLAQLSRAISEVEVINKTWPIIEKNPALAQNLQLALPMISSVEVIRLDSGRLQYAMPAPPPWHNNHQVLSVPELNTTLKQAAALQKLIAGPVTSVNPNNPTYPGALHWAAPVTTENEDIILMTGTELERLFKSVNVEAENSGLIFKIYDLARYSTDPILISGSLQTARKSNNDQSNWKYQNTVSLPERKWLVQITPGDLFLKHRESHYTLAVFITGTLFSLLLTIIVSQRSVTNRS